MVGGNRQYTRQIVTGASLTVFRTGMARLPGAYTGEPGDGSEAEMASQGRGIRDHGRETRVSDNSQARGTEVQEPGN